MWLKYPAIIVSTKYWYRGPVDCYTINHVCSRYYHIHTHIHTCTYIHTYIHTFIHTYIHTYVHTYIRTYIRTCIYIQCTYILVYYCTVWWLFIDIYIYCTYLTSRRYTFDCWIQSVTIIVISTKTVIIDSYFHNRSSLLYICITLIIIMYVSLLICVGLSHIMDWPIRSLLTFCGWWSCWTRGDFSAEEWLLAFWVLCGTVQRRQVLNSILRASGGLIYAYKRYTLIKVKDGDLVIIWSRTDWLLSNYRGNYFAGLCNIICLAYHISKWYITLFI